MSQIWESMQRAEEKRAELRANSEANKQPEDKKRQDEPQQQRPVQPAPIYVRQERTSWVVPLLVSIALVSLIGLNVQLYLIMQAHSSKIDNVITRLDKVQTSLEENRDEMYSLSSGMRQVNDALRTLHLDAVETNLALAEAEGKIDKLESINRENSRAIAGLTEDKNSLLRRYDMLDVEIRRLKQAEPTGEWRVESSK